MEFSLFLVLMAVLAADPSTANPPRSDTATCQVIVEGHGIEKLTLLKENDSVNFDSVSLPIYTYDAKRPDWWLEPGRYRVNRIELKGGYWHVVDDTKTEWFTLSPGEPYRLRLGAPLTSQVDVKREGRLLKLDYRLVDAARRRFRSTERTSPPRFVIYQNGREIASDAFEYG